VVIDALASGDQFIASSNAFWVKASQQGTLTFEESDKTLDVTVPFYKNADEAFNEMYISILNTTDSSLNDFTRLRFMEEASAAYDVLYDAPKRYSLNPNVPGITTMIDSNDFAINSFAPSDTIAIIPLKANIRTAGSYEFTFDMAGDYFDEQCMILHDLLTDEMYVIEQGGTYSFSSAVNAISDAARFVLIFRPTVKVETQAATCFNGTNGRVDITSYGEGPFTYSLFDANDEEVSTLSGGASISIEGLAYGFYTLDVAGLSGECASVQRSFFIAQPAASEAHSLVAYDTECQGDNSGEIQVLLSDSLSYDLQLFANNELIDSHYNVIGDDFFSQRTAGEYRVDVLNACDTSSYYINVSTKDSMYLDFELSADTLYLQEGAFLYCENLSVNSSIYMWAFTADQDQPYTEVNGEQLYTEAGSYDVYLFGATAAGCSRFVQKTVEVIDLSTAIKESTSENAWTEIRYSNHQIELHYGAFSQARTSIQILNEIGQVVIKDELNASSGVYKIDMDHLQAGVYLIQLQSSDGFSEVKRFVVR
jgi:hypothetical protein